MKVISFVLISILAAYSVTAETTLHLLTNSERAKCLDGSSSGYYFQPGSDEGANKFYIYLEGGYYCYGQTKNLILQNCYDRSFTDLGSSINWPSSFEGEANLSDKQVENPLFYNWNKIFVKYCDGTYFQSSAEPILFKDKTLYFRGNDNIREIFSELSNQHGMLNAETVVLAGGSAGGYSATFWAQYLRNLLPESVKMVTAVDCGLNVDFNKFMQDKNPVFVDLVTDNNRTIIQPQGCPYLYDDANLYKCFFQQFILDLIPGPVFFTSSLYDAFFLPIYLDVQCIQGRTFVNCNKLDEYKIELFRNQIINLIQAIKEKKPQWGVWAVSCIRHVFSQTTDSFNNQDYEVPAYSSITPALALKEFVQAFEEGRDTSSFFYIDNLKYPNNAACSNNNAVSA